MSPGLDGQRQGNKKKSLSSGRKLTDKIASEPATTGADGKVSFKNIAPGYYEVKETKTPDGYVQTGEGTFYVKVDSAGIKLLRKIVETSSVSFAEAEGTKVANVTIGTNGTTVTFTVENEPGVELPSTGGSGTRIFTILGSILILGAGVLLWRRRRLI